jgi:hypothetical protein
MGSGLLCFYGLSYDGLPTCHNHSKLSGFLSHVKRWRGGPQTSIACIFVTVSRLVLSVSQGQYHLRCFGTYCTGLEAQPSDNVHEAVCEKQQQLNQQHTG